MSKEAYYFSHDSNARNDDKILALRMKHGWEGYGLFWALIEKLRDSKNFTCVKDYNIIAFDLRTDAAKIKSIVEDFGLFVFTECGKYLYSESLSKRMGIRESLSEARRKAANKRWENAENQEVNANAMQMQCKTNANAMQNDAIKGKEKKGKESKVNILLQKETKVFSNQESSKTTIKNQLEEKKEKSSAKKEKDFGRAEFKAGLIDQGAYEKDVDDWFKHRKVFTKRSFDLFVSECKDNNYPVASAVKKCADNGWRGFKYQWISNERAISMKHSASSFAKNR